MRKAAHERSLQRTAARGFLPSSGIAELDSRNVDQYYDRLRTQANRDLAVNAIDRRDADLQRAQGIGSLLGLEIPRGQRQEELSLASLLYDLPRNALTDALAVINGTPTSESLFSQTADLERTNQYNQQVNAQRWAEIGRLLENLFA